MCNISNEIDGFYYVMLTNEELVFFRMFSYNTLNGLSWK